MKDWIQKKEREKLDLLQFVATSRNLPDFMIEKDWWVTALLHALFTSTLNKHLAFKGGTSLSKSWNILNRFSEDIDIVIDKSLFGVTDQEELGSNKRTKLRKDARNYVINQVKPLLHQHLKVYGIPDDMFKLSEEQSDESDKDPTTLLLQYFPISQITNDYTQSVVKIEIGVRALMEPTEQRNVSSMLAETLRNNDFVQVNTVMPQRTFWEKAFLLHELFQKPLSGIELARMSRHWYDLYCLVEGGMAKSAMNDEVLFRSIKNHRKIFTKVQGIDYDSLRASSFNLFPPIEKRTDWNKDYEVMKQSYIYRDAPTLEELEIKIAGITELLRQLNY